MIITEVLLNNTASTTPNARSLRGKCEEYVHSFNAYMPTKRRIMVYNSKTEQYIASCITNNDGTFELKGLPVTADGCIEVHMHDDTASKTEPMIYDGLSLVI